MEHFQLFPFDITTETWFLIYINGRFVNHAIKNFTQRMTVWRQIITRPCIIFSRILPAKPRRSNNQKWIKAKLKVRGGRWKNLTKKMCKDSKMRKGFYLRFGTCSLWVHRKDLMIDRQTALMKINFISFHFFLSHHFIMAGLSQHV